jgi:hypothetical protein
MVITNSPDITQLSVQVTFDLSGVLPVVSLTNLSQGPHLGNITWWFEITSPSGTIIHEGSLTTPDVIGAWTTFSITDAWPRPFQQLEWSGATYNFEVSIQDSAGNQYSDASYNASICRPSGNTNLSKNFYGISNTNVQLQCQQGSIYFQDQTNASYKGLTGTLVSSILRLVYPIDNTGNIPLPFVINNFSSASAPISYSSPMYQFQTQSVYDYDFGGNVHVRIRYQSFDVKNGTNFIVFAVLCNIDLSPLVCEFVKFSDSIENGTCSDVKEAERKLLLISPKMALVGMGLQQPLLGIDVPGLISEIEDIGDFDCDCCNAPTGIIPQTGTSFGGYTFSVNPVCGDVSGSFSLTGTNVQLNLQDKSYVFVLSSQIPTAAFTIVPATVNCLKTYTFNVDLVQLSTDILNTVKNNSGLVNLFNSIVSGSNNLMISADGKCIYTSTSTFNFTFTLTNIPSSATFSILTQITNGSSVQNLNFSFNLTNLASLQIYLNGLGIGTFVVTNPSGQTVQITSNNNPNNLSSLTYSISSTNYIANFSSSAAGYVPIAANQVIQNIINYICGITDAKITTSQAYAITYIGNNGLPQTVTIAAGSTLANLLSTLINLQDQTASNIGQATSISCTNLQAAFPPSSKSVSATDFLFATKGGSCAQLNLLDAFIFMLTASLTNPAAQNAFCTLTESCGAGLICAPYNFFDVFVTDFNSSCSEIVAIQFSIA